MKKNMMILGALAIATALTLHCKKATGEGVTAAIASVNKAMADATGPLEKAEDGAAAAKLINGVSAAMEAAMTKFPELKGEGAKSPEIKAEMEKGKAAAEKFMAAVMQATDTFKGTPEVQDAAGKFQTIIAK